jgi:hypothetical protein
MKKKGSGDLIEQVFTSVKSGPKSINDIASDVNTNWESARNALELLGKLGVVSELEEGNKRVFYLRGPNVSLNPDTLYGLPLSPEQDNLSNYLFMRIRDIWKQKTGKLPNKTQVQKVFVKAVEDCSLPVPIGWYKFGMMGVKNYDPLLNYSFSSPADSEKIDSCVVGAVDFYKSAGTVRELKLLQYRTKENILYQCKDELSEISYVKFNEGNRNHLRYLLTEFAFDFHSRNDDKDVSKLVNDFVSTMISLVRNSDDTAIDIYRIDLVEGFDALWDLVATCMLYKSLLGGFYKKEQLDFYMGYIIEAKKMTLRDHISYLEGFVKPASETSFKDKEFLDKFRGSATLKTAPTEEEIKQAAEAMVRKKSSDVFREHDLN